MDTIISIPIMGERFHVCACMSRAPDQLYHIAHTCTHYAVPGGQASGEMAAMSHKLLTHDDAADLAWWLEALIS